MFSDDIDQMIILIVASLASMMTFIMVVLPILNRSEKREHYSNVIEKKRKALFDQTKDQLEQKKKTLRLTNPCQHGNLWHFSLKCRTSLAGLVKKSATRCFRPGFVTPKRR